jgi:lysozyme
LSQVHGVLDRDALVAQLIRDEGIRLKPYVDCCGRDWRACVATPCAAAAKGHRGKLTIGIGRNLDDVGISREEATLLLGSGPTNDIDREVSALKAALPWWPALDDVRQRVLADMAFNMGAAEILADWQPTLRLIASGDYREAAKHMRASVWAGEVGARAERLARAMESGKDAGFA